ncbi:MAG: hypothetical protein IKC43_00295, partial [Clostridia bacterium]|nr:hypothetical protein [Clostridia bacterium]
KSGSLFIAPCGKKRKNANGFCVRLTRQCRKSNVRQIFLRVLTYFSVGEAYNGITEDDYRYTVSGKGSDSDRQGTVQK